MKTSKISLRRRHLMIAGAAGVAAPAGVFAGQFPERAAAAAELVASEGAGTTVVSGRILGADSRPLFNAAVEVWQGAGADRGSATTDADGRFFTTIPAARRAGRPSLIHYRVSHQGRVTPAQQLEFARGRGISADRVAQLRRDDAGVWRATFGVTLA